MSVDSMERIIGIRTIDHNGFSADFLRGDAVKHQREALLALTTRVDAVTFMREPEQVARGEELKFKLTDKHSVDSNSTSMILYRRANAPAGEIGEYHGYSLQQELEVQTSRGTQIVLCWLTRAYEKDFRDKGLGRFDIQQGLIRHERAEAIFHRTINPVSPWSILRSGVVNPRLYYPWPTATLYGRGQGPEGQLAQEIMYQGFFVLREAGIAKSKLLPHDLTGVASGDDLPNQAYEPKPDHWQTRDLLEHITRKLRAVPDRGDRVYSVGLLEPLKSF